MTYDEAMSFWYGRINYEVRAARPGDLKLERMAALLNELGNPHHRLRIIHITGTKGKGSTAAMIAAVLQSAGYRVGLFTSPHLSDVRERMQVDRVSISADELTARMEEIAPVIRASERMTQGSATFFEMGTAIGMLHFLYRRCDVVVMEVGLGGRFDSTNVCRPLVSVITNVGWDHMAQLGNSLEEIAFQKAGIIKHGIPVISGVDQPGPRQVIQSVAETVGAPLREVVNDLLPRVAIGLPGAHQRANARLTVAVVESLRNSGLSIPQSAVESGLRNVNWPARIECISQRPTIILDTAHNVSSAEALVQTLATEFEVSGRKTVIFAVSADKQYEEILRILVKYFDRFILTRFGNNPRCVSPQRIADILSKIAADVRCEILDNSRLAWQKAHSTTTPNDLICITGSVFLAGELMPELDRIRIANLNQSDAILNSHNNLFRRD